MNQRRACCLCRCIVSGPASASYGFQASASTHHTSSIVLSGQRGIALYGDQIATVNMLHNSNMLGDFVLSGKIKHHNVARLKARGDPLTCLPVGICQIRAGCRFSQMKTRLPEHPPYECHAPRIGRAADSPAIKCRVVFDTVGTGGGFLCSNFSRRDSQYVSPRSHRQPRFLHHLFCYRSLHPQCSAPPLWLPAKPQRLFQRIQRRSFLQF